jgi:hypothetical protein
MVRQKIRLIEMKRKRLDAVTEGIASPQGFYIRQAR